ncbi:hypothetical protein EDB83DRAFT_2513734 [Lactarius deliciosus]|nr:hypothetical protein EDB83DRAFT_2513734 [Lactarius deliciosus]
MAQAPSPSKPTSPSNFQPIFNVALKAYEGPSRASACNTASSLQLPGEIIAVLQDKINEFDQSRVPTRDYRWLNPTNVLYAFSAMLGEGVGLVFSPAKDIGICHAQKKEVDASQDALVDLLERIENFIKRLEYCSAVRPTDVMTDITVKIMIEMLNIFAIATEMRQSRMKKEMEVALKRGCTDLEPHARRNNKRARGRRASYGRSLLSNLCLDQLTLPHGSTIIQDIETSRKTGLASVAYFYFDFKDLDMQNRSHLFSSNFLHDPVPVVTSSTAFIWNMTVEPSEAALTRVCSQFPINAQFSLSWTLDDAQTQLASRHLVNRFSLLSRSSWTFAYLIFTSASPSISSLILGLLGL